MGDSNSALKDRNFETWSTSVPTPSGVLDESFDAVPGAAERIVVVDDNANIRRLAQQILEEAGYEVEAYASGPEALAAIARDSRPISLLVTDFEMPEFTGYELALRVRAERPEMPVIIASGLPEDNVMPDGELRVRFPFLPKPYSLRSLARKIREVLELTTPAPVSGFVGAREDLSRYPV